MFKKVIAAILLLATFACVIQSYGQTIDPVLHQMFIVSALGSSVDPVTHQVLLVNSAGTPTPFVFASGTLAVTDSATVGCVDQSTAVANATTGMVVDVSPVGAPAGAGAGNITWSGYCTAGNVVIRVCTVVAVTAAATTYNYRILN